MGKTWFSRSWTLDEDNAARLEESLCLNLYKIMLTQKQQLLDYLKSRKFSSYGPAKLENSGYRTIYWRKLIWITFHQHNGTTCPTSGTIFGLLKRKFWETLISFDVRNPRRIKQIGPGARLPRRCDLNLLEYFL